VIKYENIASRAVARAMHGLSDAAVNTAFNKLEEFFKVASTHGNNCE
jgi:hypothetical protein